MRTSEKGIEFIKHHEGFRSEAYQCAAGHWTIGYGDTLGVRQGDTITEEDADARLRARLIEFENAVERYIEAPLSQSQFDACVSLAYNIGPMAFGTSSVARFANIGAKRRAADSFLLWNKGKVDGALVVLPGLTKRRAAERELFLS